MAHRGLTHEVDVRHPDLSPAPSPARSGPGLPAIDPEPTTAVPIITHSDHDQLHTWVSRAQNGDREAFAQIYDRYVDNIYRYLYYRTLSAQLAEDLTSETFIRALRSLGSFRWEGRDIGAWLVTIARNLTADHFKSSSFRRELVTDDISAMDQVSDSPETHVLDKLDSQQLLTAIAQLKPEQRECICLRFLQEMSLSETASVMKRSEGAVKQLQFRAIRALARLLEQDRNNVGRCP